MFLLVIQKIFGLSLNTLTTDEKYFLLIRENFTQPIQMQISKKEKELSTPSFVFLKSSTRFEHFEKEHYPQSLYISEMTDCEMRAQINVQKTPFDKTLKQVTWQMV